ncbi:MAG TPA: benzoate-CoA ligase family protein [Vicinamibacterales bacterium]|nr:benzoate-CoA ligase family protein [Vicinamibacterales bacterium]
MSIPESFNLAAYLVERHVREGRGDRVALLTATGQTTYAELDALVNRAGNALAALGVAPEGRVALILHDGLAFYTAFLGAIRIGAVPVPVNTLLRRNDFQYILNDSRAQVVIVSAPLAQEVLPITGLLRSLKHLVISGGEPGTLPSFETLVDAASSRLDPSDTHKDDPAFWLYSSGSTGPPKGTVHLQHDPVYTIEGYARGVLAMTERDRCFSAAKLFFAYGLGNSLTFPLGLGAQAVVFPGRPGPDALFEAIDRYRPSLFFAVPTLYAAMLQVEAATTRYDLSSLRVCVSAGEALPSEIFRRWRERFGLEIVDGIGSTEMLHIFISNRPGACRPGTTGLEVPGYEAKIVDDDGLAVPSGTIGTLLVSGDSAAAGYWKQHEKTKKTFQGDWVNTGDKYVRDEDGYYRYCGRSDDMLKVGGIWVSPAEVENTVLAHPAVVECAVVGATDTDGLTKPKAFVVLRPGLRATHETAREIQAFVKANIAPFKYPRWVEIVDEIPKTATGKIQRFRLR